MKIRYDVMISAEHTNTSNCVKNVDTKKSKAHTSDNKHIKYSKTKKSKTFQQINYYYVTMLCHPLVLYHKIRIGWRYTNLGTQGTVRVGITRSFLNNFFLFIGRIQLSPEKRFENHMLL